jgi:L-cysteine S-thiosulfotransferase
MRLRTFGQALALVFAASFAAAQSGGERGGGEARRTGYQDMSVALQQMEDDDMSNPGMLFVQSGEALWKAPAGKANKACADCHGAVDTSMKGVAARYPAFPKSGDKPVDLEGRINLCRTGQQQAEALKPESDELLALDAYVTHASRGLPIAPPDDPRLAKVRDQGRALFSRREGQLNLSCATCHDDNAGKKLAGATIPQGHPTAYPVYRLEWQTLGSLKRRLRNCVIGMRAEVYAYDATEYVALEVYLMDRAKGLKIESPGLRP